MPYFPTTTTAPKALLATPGSVCWLLGGLTPNADPNAVMDVYGETTANGASIPCSPAFNQGRSVNTFSMAVYFPGGGTATVALQGSMTNRSGDFITLTAVNGVFQTNLPFLRALISASTAGTIAVGLIY